MKDSYSLSVAFCAVSETYSLRDSFAKISAYGFGDEYLFVLSKNATEDCVKTVRELCENDNCRYIVQSGYGLGNAIRDTMDSVTGSHMIIWPADDDMDSASFPEMVKLSRENPEKIISVSRWLAEDGFQGYGRIRKVINYISQKLFALLFKSRLTDFTNPTQISPVEIYRSIKWTGNGFDFIPEMIFKPVKLGYEFIEVPCRNITRREGSTNSNYFELAKYYYAIYKIYRMDVKDISKGA